MNTNKIITDPEVKKLADCAELMSDEYKLSAIWEGSPFSWLKGVPSRKVGKIGEKLVAEWLRSHGFSVSPAGNTEADILVDDKRVEVKFSTLWEADVYKFQQIRDQRYDFLICLGVSPFNAHSWVFTKEFLMNNWGKVTGFDSQHGGKAGSDTAWISFNPQKPHDWLKGKGGSLSVAVEVFRKLLSSD